MRSMDFIFIDAGHSEETIMADWKNLQPSSATRRLLSSMTITRNLRRMAVVT